MRYIKSALVLLLLMFVFCINTSADATVPILLYHNVLEEYPDSDSIVTVTPNMLEQHIISLLNAGYTPISFDDYLNASKGISALPEKPVIITFDDGYETNYTYAYPLFKKYNVKATIFVAAKYMGETPGLYKHFTWEQARDMQNSGLVSIQSHTYSHENMTEKDLYSAESEIRYSKYLIEKNLGTKCNVLAFPYGFHNTDLLNRAHRAGYDIAVQVGNFGSNTLADTDKALVRITVYGFWTGDDLLWNIANFQG